MSRIHQIGVRAAAPRLPEETGLRIAETFRSIQGEGKLTGVPSFFLRVSGCNLRCVWCDTPYASWNPEGDRRSIARLVEEAAGSGVRHVVVTGGEPMLFEPVIQLTRELKARGLHLTIETAGTVWHPVVCDLMSISPKLASSTPGDAVQPDPRDPTGSWRKRHEERRLNLPVLQRLIYQFPERQLKFVVTGPPDLHEIESILGQLTGWSPPDVLLMPEGVTTPSAEAKQWLVAECLARGYRYCPRLHIELFGNTRGT
jgi:7-carboxy-7-deazaguanine synthase